MMMVIIVILIIIIIIIKPITMPIIIPIIMTIIMPILMFIMMICLRFSWFVSFSSFSKSKDMLILGSTYRYLSKNLSRKNNDFVSLSYYLKLLEVQFLPFFIF